MLYYAPGACHAPHHTPREWIDRYKGKFDMGYEAMREQTLARQIELGIVPADTVLPEINPIGTPATRKGPDDLPFPPLDETRPWDSLSDDEKHLFSRMAEVYAGMMSHTDHHIGRLLDFLESIEERENTLVILVSDNGASGEGGPNGSVNEMKFANGIPDDIASNLAQLDELGGPTTYNHYPNGWAMAFNTPFKMWKRYEFNGGTCDPCIISWPQGMKARNELRTQYHHAIDLVPTILDVLGVEAPETIKGHVQSRFDGVSMRYSFDDDSAPSARSTQFYSMLGSRGIWHDGWKAITTHPTISGWSHFNDDVWELYHTDVDRAEVHNLADEHPEKVRELVALWYAEAGANGAFPLDDRSALEIFISPRPVLSPPRDRYVYFPDSAEVPEAQAVNVRNRSYTIGALVDLPGAATRQAVLEFVAAVTDPDSSDFVPEVDRVAVFDNDGTLSNEMPLYTQLAFALDRAAELGHPTSIDELRAGGIGAVLELVKLTHGNVSTDEFDTVCRRWIAEAEHPRFGRPYPSLVYQPMRELIGLLGDHAFTCWIFSGGGTDFMRTWAPAVLGLAPHRLIGSSGTTEFRVGERLHATKYRPSRAEVNPVPCRVRATCAHQPLREGKGARPQRTT